MAALALLIDTVIVYTFNIALLAVVDTIFIFLHSHAIKTDNGSDAILTLIFLLSNVFYYPFFESSRLQATPGKSVCGLKVVGAYGTRISIGNALGRYLGKFLSAMVCYAGFLVVLINDTRQAWHDQLAKTYVIRPGK